MREFYVCTVDTSGNKTAVITENDQVVGVVDGEGLSNTELLRMYANYIKELFGDVEARIITNHERVKRKYHIVDLPNLSFIYRYITSQRRQSFYDAACAWADKQDEELGE